MSENESDWNEEMGCTWEEAEAWAATPKWTVEEAMTNWMRSRQHEAER